MEKYDYDFDYEEDNVRRFGKCPRCGQENRPLTFFLAGHNGSIVSGWVCNECYRKMKEGN